MTVRVRNTLARLLGLLFLLALSVPVALQLPFVQNRIAGKATEFLNSRIDGAVSIGGVHLQPDGALVIRDLVVLDDSTKIQTDTFFCARFLSASFGLSSLMKGRGLHFKRVNISGGGMNLVTEHFGRDGTNLHRIFHLHPKDSIPDSGSVFDISKVTVSSFRFTLTNVREDRPVRHGNVGIDYNNLDLVADIRARDLKFVSNRMYGHLDHLNAVEKSGYRLGHVEGDCGAGCGTALITGIRIEDEWTSLKLDHVNMYYDYDQAFANFIEDVELDVEVTGGSVVSMHSVCCLGGVAAFKDNAICMDLQALKVRGPVCALNVEELIFRDRTTGVKGKVKGCIAGLPDIRETTLDFEVEGVCFSSDEMERFVSYWSPAAKVNLSRWAPGLPLVADGGIHGLLNNPDVHACLDAGSRGMLSARLSLSNILDGDAPLCVGGLLDTQSLDVGSVAGIKGIGDASLHARAYARMDRQEGLKEAVVDTLWISGARILDYDYSGVRASGTYSDGALQASLCSLDPNLRLDADVALRGSRLSGNLECTVEGKLKHADLYALHFDKRDSLSIVRSDFGLSAANPVPGRTDVTVNLSGLQLVNSYGVHECGDLRATLLDCPVTDNLTVCSPFVQVDVTYDGGPKELLAAMRGATLERSLPSLYRQRDTLGSSLNLEAAVEFHDCRHILAYLLPGAYISDSTCVHLTLKESEEFSARVQSPRIAYGANNLKGVTMTVDNAGGELCADFRSRELNALGYKFLDGALRASACRDDFSVAFGYASVSDDEEGRAELNLDGRLRRVAGDSLEVTARPHDSLLQIGSDTWQLDSSVIRLGAADLSFEGLSLRCADKCISLDGGVSRRHSDKLTLNVDNVSLASLDRLLRLNYGFSGNVDGGATLLSPVGDKLALDVKMNCEGVRSGSREAGDFLLEGGWDETASCFRARVRNTLPGVQGRTPLSVDASYRPEGKLVDATAVLDSLNPAIATPFLSNIFDDISGSVSGSVTARGPLNELVVTGRGTRLDDVCLALALNGVTYTLNGPFEIGEKALLLSRTTVTDGAGGLGTIKGSVSYEHLRNASLDVKFDFDKFRLLDAPEKGNKGFYGLLDASGIATVKGPVSRLVIDSDVRTVGDGQVHVPLGGSLISPSSDLLSFSSPPVEIDPYELMLQQMNGERKSVKGKYAAHVRVSATPGVTAYIEIDKSTGNVLSAHGSGTVDLDIDPSRDQLNLNGQYIISGGKYHFAAAGVISRDFSIGSGSSLTFAGEPKNSNLDISATYNLRTSLSNILTDSTSVSSRRPVVCGIGISGKLGAPQMSFSVNVPDLDPSTKAQVESALNTEDKMHKQFVALLVMGNFLPNEQSGVFNSSNMLYSNVSGMMSGQLNSILQRLDIPVDFGFAYQQNKRGTNIFDVAVSTQLFNDRVTIGGSVGNRERSGSVAGNQSDLVGNVDLSIKLDKPGMLRLNLFSHAPDSFSNVLDQSQRNGAGFSFQKEFGLGKHTDTNYTTIEIE